MKKILLTAALTICIGYFNTIKAQSEPFLGQIAFVPYDFAPSGWLQCNGQVLQINQNVPLFSLLGTTYGGNGFSTFALPDMRGKVLVHNGQLPGGSNYNLGQTGGAESVTLLQSQMPSHTHGVNAVSAEGNQNSPSGNLPADTKVLDKEYSDAASNVTMKSNMIGNAGGSQPHENRPPYLTLKCIIAVQGIYPPHP